ncbi:MAG: SusC/RagA family TonB-linked outer membrane protein [Bacteroidetes bacterium]|nr:MAG: SusC/RagA family TonB-linked outer membrane protein [Bacteroidota bacterium]
MNYFKNKFPGKHRFFSMMASCTLLLLFMATSIAYGQEKTIPVVKGIVKDDAGEILTGATVSIKGTKIFITTKNDGTFELKNVPEGSVLTVSYVGHTRTEIKLKPGQAEITIKMASSTGVLSEVVVNNGLYKRPAGNFTGAAKTYTGEQLKSVNPSNVLQALAVVDPAVRIEQDNALGSDPNQLPIIQIRGQNNLPVGTQGSAAASATPVSNGDIMSSYLLNPNQPLIILDGFQSTLQTIYDMDINRIASITVLKDSAATTAYGSKAANGVIVVETKQPTAGRTQVTYAINMAVDIADLTSYHLMDAKSLLEAQRIAGVYSDPNNHFNDVGLKQWYDYRLQQVQSGVNTYWLSQPVRNGFSTNHSLNISGGARSVRYGLSLNYSNGVGVMKGSGRDRLGLNYNLTYTNKSFRFSNNTTVGYSKGNNTPWGSYSQYASQFPFFKPTDSAGNTIKIFEPVNTTLGIATQPPGGIFTNAAYNAGLEMKNYSYTLSFSNNTNVEWTISKEMRMRAAISFLNNLPGSEAFYPADHTMFANAIVGGFTDLGSYSQTQGKNTAIDGKLSFDYNKKFGAHTIMAAFGVSGQATESNSTTIQVTGLPNDYLNQLGMANGYGSSIKPGSTSNVTRSLSSYASISYNYADRYTAEITANASGSSQFGSNNRLAPFWAGGVAWNVDKERFFKKNSIIQQLRLRMTTGITGNQNFAAHMSQPIFQYNLLNNYRLQLGAIVETYANPDLKWQQTIKNNFGLSAGLFNGKINIGFDYYTENTDNLILPLDVAPSTGFVNYQDNLGAVKNSGYEFSITSPIIQNRKKNIFWSLSFNVGHYENVITKLSPAIEALNKANNNTFDPKLQITPLPRYEVGQSMSRIWAVPSLGIDPATGKEVFVKLDGSKTFTWDPNDKRPVGDATSKLKGMVASNFNYKGFTFNINLSFNYGGQKYNQTLVDKIENVDLLHSNADERVLTERWKQPGDIVSFKSLVASGGQQTNSTSRFVQDNNYLEASSITVGYSFPPNLAWVKKMHLSTPRLFITQANVLRLATIKTERGTGYPFSRTFNFGLSTTF